MIDFKNKKVFKLSEASEKEVSKNLLPTISPILIDDENIIRIYSSIRDFVVFTDKRIISVNVQGFTGSKKDFTSLPYSRIQAFSVETAGTFDLDSELELSFSGLGSVKFEFTHDSSIIEISKTIAKYIF